MKKKIVSILLCGALILSFGACGSMSDAAENETETAETGAGVESAESDAAEEENLSVEEETETEAESDADMDEEKQAEETAFLEDLESSNPDLYQGYLEVMDVMSYVTANISVINEDYDLEWLSDMDSEIMRYYAIDQDLFGLAGRYEICTSQVSGHEGGITTIEYQLDNAEDFDTLVEYVTEMFGEDYYDASDEYGADYWWETRLHVCDFDLQDKLYDDGSGLTGILFMINETYDTINADFQFK